MSIDSGDKEKALGEVSRILGNEEDPKPLKLILMGSTLRITSALIAATSAMSPKSPTQQADALIRTKLLKPLQSLTVEERQKLNERVVETELTRAEAARINEIFHKSLTREDIEIMGMSAADLGGMVKGRDMTGIAESEKRFKRDNYEAFNDFNSAIESIGGVPDEDYIHSRGQIPPA